MGCGCNDKKRGPGVPSPVSSIDKSKGIWTSQNLAIEAEKRRIMDPHLIQKLEVAPFELGVRVAIPKRDGTKEVNYIILSDEGLVRKATAAHYAGLGRHFLVQAFNYTDCGYCKAHVKEAIDMATEVVEAASLGVCWDLKYVGVLGATKFMVRAMYNIIAAGVMRLRNRRRFKFVNGSECNGKPEVPKVQDAKPESSGN